MTGGDDARRAEWIPADSYGYLTDALEDRYAGKVFAAHVAMLRQFLTCDPVTVLEALGAVWSRTSTPTPAASSTPAPSAACCAATRRVTARRSAPPDTWPWLTGCMAGPAEVVRDGLQGTALRRLPPRQPGWPRRGGLALLVIIAVGAREVWPKVVHAVEIAAWTVAGIIGAAIVVTGTVLTVRVVRRVRARRAARQVTYHITPRHPGRAPDRPPAIDQRRAARARPAPAAPARGVAAARRGGKSIRPRIGGDGDEHRPR